MTLPTSNTEQTNSDGILTSQLSLCTPTPQTTKSTGRKLIAQIIVQIQKRNSSNLYNSINIYEQHTVHQDIAFYLINIWRPLLPINESTIDQQSPHPPQVIFSRNTTHPFPSCAFSYWHCWPRHRLLCQWHLMSPSPDKHILYIHGRHTYQRLVSCVFSHYSTHPPSNPLTDPL